MNAGEWQERGGRLWRAVFYAPSFLYGAAVRLRAVAYSRGYVETVRLPAPVFCVGNLTAGGSGKTPGVLWLAHYLRRKGRRPAVITRGYGRRGGESCLVVSDGRGPRGDVRETGDEPRLLASRLPGVAVLAGADRAAAGRRALEEFGADCLVMDDGYQHLRLARDVDLLCLDAGEAADILLGRRGGLLLPAGRLREPLSGLSRAHVVLLTKADLAPPEELASLRRALEGRLPGVPVVPVRYGLSFWDAAAREAVPAERLRGLPVLALTGLARPGSFEEGLRRLGADVAALRHPDHHVFTAAERETALLKARREGRTVVVTEKDWQRLPPDFSCWVARLDWTPDEEGGKAWTDRIDSAIA